MGDVMCKRFVICSDRGEILFMRVKRSRPRKPSRHATEAIFYRDYKTRHEKQSIHIQEDDAHATKLGGSILVAGVDAVVHQSGGLGGGIPAVPVRGSSVSIARTRCPGLSQPFRERCDV
jgi:hypothetical protein